MSTPHIHPIHDKMVTRTIRESILKQHGGVYWMTGLSGSGKSTIAVGLERELLARGYQAVVLDGDNIRSGLNSDLTFTVKDRLENIRRIAEVSKLFCQFGWIVVASFISPTKAMRSNARTIIGTEDFHEIYINTPLEICEARDVKGLYKKVRAGEINNFTGIDSPYEAPTNAFIQVDTENQSVNESIDVVLLKIINKTKVVSNEL